MCVDHAYKDCVCVFQTERMFVFGGKSPEHMTAFLKERRREKEMKKMKKEVVTGKSGGKEASSSHSRVIGVTWKQKVKK